MLTEASYKIFVYGSCHFSEQLDNDIAIGTGGYGAVIESNGQLMDQVAGGMSSTTNARMDLMGIIDGLEMMQKIQKTQISVSIVIYLSNGYIIDALTKGWLEGWAKSGFKKKKHADLWRKLRKVLQDGGHAVRFEHSKNVRYSKSLLLAEQLGKQMSGKRGLPVDLQSSTNGLFDADLTDNSASGSFSDGSPGIAASEKLTYQDDQPILESICVDASTMGNPGVTEYRGVDTKTREILFQHRYEEATNNIGEFLAIVHALALYKRKGKVLNILYSDSANAISWVKQKKCKTKYGKNADNTKLFDDIQRAVAWLEQNEYTTKILKWNTGAWGQIPADYGRK